jgi:hypothetical protein|tara:strand:- start:5 stop:253 length:249 start_codon:yes stop_codon:yes gene_type:complete
MLVKVLAAETDLTSATNVSNATLVRLVNNANAIDVVTRKTSGGTTVGSFTMVANSVEYVEKDPTDTLEGGATILAAKVAYGN